MVSKPNDYFTAFKASITRISHRNGVVVGAGFLVSPQCVITCAHVVTEALGIPQNTTQAPTSSINLDFPLIAAGQKIQAQVVFWQPVNPSEVGEDIAVLKLEHEPPDTVQPVRLVTAEDWWEHPLRVFGFPSGHNDGVWATGVLRGEQGNGWVQMEAVNVPGYQVEPGFSGAPVWDEKLAGVVGMAVAAERQRENVKAAFMIPTKVLCQAWSELGQYVIDSEQTSSTEFRSTVSSFRQAKIESLQQTLSDWIADYQGLHNQLNNSLSKLERDRLTRQLTTLEEEINQVETELKSLMG
ncbi:MAG: trypsin-like peptidase domain-containing protein [Stigonema ocellatum SAG 48.90 = DSM 106950]|nr:trypsin-like peptidase domain-containing protein [Stigonema ocellatum SAG 48.90 = DSM 106950]